MNLFLTSICYLFIHVLLDSIYLISTHSFVKHTVAAIQGMNINQVHFRSIPVIPSFIVYAIGVWYFIVYFMWKRVKKENKMNYDFVYVLNATIFALSVFGVFNLCNYIMFENYTIKNVSIDMTWGIFSLNLISVIMYIVLIQL